MTNTTPCNHPNFVAQVNVARLEDVGRFMAEITVACEVCGMPFQFLGLEPGLDLHGARVSVDGLEARIAICPRGQKPSPLGAIQFNLRAGGPHHG